MLPTAVVPSNFKNCVLQNKLLKKIFDFNFDGSFEIFGFASLETQFQRKKAHFRIVPEAYINPQKIFLDSD